MANKVALYTPLSDTVPCIVYTISVTYLTQHPYEIVYVLLKYEWHYIDIVFYKI